MKTVQWQLQITSAPAIIKHCKKCGTKTRHISSGLFRVNAQQKSLDIWLVYNCGTCKTSWNSTILSCVNPGGMDRKLLERFTNNDPDLALRYAMDAELLRRNGVECELPDYQIIGEDVGTDDSVQINLSCPYPTKIRLSKILREKLKVSNREFQTLVETGMIKMQNRSNLLRAKLYENCVILTMFPSQGINSTESPIK